jgi:hypothetical protein
MLSRAMRLALIVVGCATLIANPAFAGTAPKKVSANNAFASVSQMHGSPGGVYMVLGWDGRVVGTGPGSQYPLSSDAGCFRERELIAASANQKSPRGSSVVFISRSNSCPNYRQISLIRVYCNVDNSGYLRQFCT